MVLGLLVVEGVAVYLLSLVHYLELAEELQVLEGLGFLRGVCRNRSCIGLGRLLAASHARLVLLLQLAEHERVKYLLLSCVPVSPGDLLLFVRKRYLFLRWRLGSTLINFS